MGERASLTPGASDPAPLQSRQVLWRAGELVLIAVLYYALARGSLLFASVNASASPIWPPTGLALAVVLLRGNLMAAAVLAGAFAANLTNGTPVAASGAVAVGNALEALVGAILLRRFAGGEKALLSPMGVGKFALIVSGAATPVSATVGVTALAVSGLASWADYSSVWATWWLGDLAGGILAGPVLILWFRSWSGAGRRITGETLAAFAAAICVGLVAFSPFSPAPWTSRSALTFLAILPLLWAALRLGPRDTVSVALILSAFAIFGVRGGTGPFIQANPNESFLLLLAFIVSATLPSLALAAQQREVRATLTQTREELLHAQKLDALGQLTSGVAHDFNNLLAALDAGLHALERPDADRTKIVETMRVALARGTSLTKQLLGFARPAQISAERIETHDALSRVELLLAPSLNGTIRVDVRAAPDTWPIRVDRHQFELAILNLALNARDAMPEGGELSITAENVAEGTRQLVFIRVSDTGIGMNADLAAKAFEPFFSTKPAGQGTGLGLAQVSTFAKQSAGRASIESELGRGTSVILALPRA